MKVHDLTEEQVEKLCEYILRTYDQDDKGLLKNLDIICAKCPFSVYVGEVGWYECGKPDFEKELPKEFEEVIK